MILNCFGKRERKEKKMERKEMRRPKNNETIFNTSYVSFFLGELDGRVWITVARNYFNSIEIDFCKNHYSFLTLEGMVDILKNTDLVEEFSKFLFCLKKK